MYKGCIFVYLHQVRQNPRIFKSLIIFLGTNQLTSSLLMQMAIGNVNHFFLYTIALYFVNEFCLQNLFESDISLPPLNNQNEMIAIFLTRSKTKVIFMFSRKCYYSILLYYLDYQKFLKVFQYSKSFCKDLLVRKFWEKIKNCSKNISAICFVFKLEL